MKPSIARSAFLAMALGLTTYAAYAWQEPAPQIIAAAPGLGQCLPSQAVKVEAAQPDHDLLLLLYGLSQSLGNAS